jgi:hypothetical protein
VTEGSNYAVRVGGGLVVHQPMTAELRAAHERERQHLESEAQQRRDAALERRQQAEFMGAEAHTHQEILAAMSADADRQDRREAARQRPADAEAGKAKQHIPFGLATQAEHNAFETKRILRKVIGGWWSP